MTPTNEAILSEDEVKATIAAMLGELGFRLVSDLATSHEALRGELRMRQIECNERKDEIASLRSECERLKQKLIIEDDRLCGEYAKLEHETNRLRKALEEIAGIEKGMGVHRPCCSRGQAIARAALNPPPKESNGKEHP